MSSRKKSRTKWRTKYGAQYVPPPQGPPPEPATGAVRFHKIKGYESPQVVDERVSGWLKRIEKKQSRRKAKSPTANGAPQNQPMNLLTDANIPNSPS